MAERPVLVGVAKFYFDSWLFLSPYRARHFDGSQGFIPISEIEAYARNWGVGDPDDRREFIMIMRALDSEYQRLVAEKRKESK